MKIIIKRIIGFITSFFDRIIGKEAKRVNEFNGYIFETETDEGGEIFK